MRRDKQLSSRFSQADVEALERRRLLSSDTVSPLPPPILLQVPSDGIVRIDGSVGNNDLILTFYSDRLSFLAHQTGGTYLLSGIRKVIVDAKRGNDRVVIDTSDASTTLPPITINAGAGDDSVIGGAGAERILGGEGNDLILGQDGRDTIYGEAGDDSIRGGGGSDLIDGGDGTDTLRGDAGNDNLAGGANPDRLRGSDGNDRLDGGGGRDLLAGENGDDRLIGGAGDDVVNGGSGFDVFEGGSGIDTIEDDLDQQRIEGSGLEIGGLTKTGAGKLDLNNSKLITSGGSSVVGSGATWNGGGIVTTQTDAALGGGYTLIGVATGSEVRGVGSTSTDTWGGQTITGSDTLVMYTYGGDADLSGRVDVDDYFQIDLNASQGGALTGWYNGDFNYDGLIDIDDYAIIDSANATPGAP